MIDFVMLMQFPEEDCNDVYFAEGIPREDFDYPVYYDKVLTVSRSIPLDRVKQIIKLQCKRQGLAPVDHLFYTAKWWCQRVVYENR